MADVQKRARLFASIDRVFAFVTGEDTKEEFMNMSVGALDARISQLKSAYDRALDEQFEILAATVEQEDKLLQERTFDEHEKNYLAALGKLNDRKRELDNNEAHARTSALESMVRSLREQVDQSMRQSEIGRVTSTPINENPPTLQNQIDSANGQLSGNSPLPAAVQPTPPSVSLTVESHTAVTTPPAVSPAAVSPAASPTPNRSDISATSHLGLKLKNQELPKFNGEMDKWLAFRGSFEPHVHNNAQYPPLTKFTILSTHLSGMAAEVIAGFQPSADNYAEAWRLLCETFDNKKLMVMSLIKSLRSLKPVNVNDTNGLRYIKLKFTQVMRSLHSIGIKTDSWDPMLVYDLNALLDSETRQQWELRHASTEMPKFADMMAFLQTRTTSMQQFAASNVTRQPTNNNNNQRNSNNNGGSNNTSGNRQSQQNRQNNRAIGYAGKNNSAATSSSNSSQCVSCKSATHTIESCQKFLEMNPYPRFQRAQQLKLCFGCLSDEHRLETCTSANNCTHCNQNRKHHHLLCFAWADNQRNSNILPPKTVGVMATQCERRETNSIAQPNRIDTGSNVLLATALIYIRASNGELMIARAMCDNGAQANLIQENFVRMLRLNRHAAAYSLDPVGGVEQLSPKGMTQFSIASLDLSFEIGISACIVQKIVPSMQPQQFINIGRWNSEVTDHWADPTLSQPGNIDVLLGGHVWSQIIMQDIRRNSTTDLVAQRSRFGWLLLGGIQRAAAPIIGCLAANPRFDIETCLKRLFEVEELPELHPERTVEEQVAHETFMEGVTRAESGRYVVPIPILPDAPLLGNSYNTAMKRLLQNERRFAKDPEFRSKYMEFMRDYLDQGHMSEFNDPIESHEQHYFIPHHGIINSTQSKFRVVFDGSSVTTSGVSCNDIQATGEKIQDSLNEICLRFRLHPIALTADIKQMYRQILVVEEQRKLQLILWRFSTAEPVRIYVLNTVTYGMRYAPYSAVMVLQEHARRCMEKYPVAAPVALADYYMDDMTSGTDTVEEAISLRTEMQQLMDEANLPLCKWQSNSWAVLEDIGDSNSTTNMIRSLSENDTTSVLGVVWNPVQDVIQFSVQTLNLDSAVLTKRTITSETSKIFDPTGLLSAVVIVGKLIIRQLWELKTDWDDPAPCEAVEKWHSYVNALPALQNIQVKRWFSTTRLSAIELHGFCDASEQAMAAVIYCRVVTSDGNIETSIVKAKTKVAPMGKNKLTVPRLELGAAVILAELMQSVKIAFEKRNVRAVYWSDSKIVLGWLNQSPNQQKTYVSNRVARVQKLTKDSEWIHVRTHENPADVASRGIPATQLVEHQLWWEGPPFLRRQTTNWTLGEFNITMDEQAIIDSELRPAVVGAVTIQSEDLVSRSNDFYLNCIVMAYANRFIDHLKLSVKKSAEITEVMGVEASEQLRLERQINKAPVIAPLSRQELFRAEETLIIASQHHYFKAEIVACQQQKLLPRSSRLLGLAPFIDEIGMLRASGRTENASVPWYTRLPIILEGKSAIANQMILAAHLKSLHGGAQLVSQYLREKYWLVGGREVIKRCIDQCVECTTQKYKTGTQQMAALVPSRVNAGRAFRNVSIDYCGPFEIKRLPGRCKVFVKCYVCLFVCMATRAIHLELVTDLTTEAFMDAFHRFESRRGRCDSITSDNATTFTCASKRLDQIRDTWQKCSQLSNFAKWRIDWHFIAPRSPHQGGLHEAGVKSFKHHLRRMVDTHSIAMEDMQTIVTKIEACLNSRPIGMFYDDSKDLVPLTPAHFIIGEPMIGAPLDVFSDEKEALISRYRRTQYLYQELWNRWYKEHVNFMLTRTKWQQPAENFKVNDIVLIHEDNYPPRHWPLARITEVHPGPDGLVRNVTVKHQNGTCKRSIQKLCKLPISE